MNKTVIAVGAGLLILSGLAAVGQSGKDDVKDDQDRAKIEKELRDLENERAKLDARIGELRGRVGSRVRRMRVLPDNENRVEVRTENGHTRVYRNGKITEELNLDNTPQGKELTPEQRKEVDEAMQQAHKAMEEARRAVEKAQKDLPPGFVMPDVEGIVGDAMRNSFRVFTGPDGAHAYSFATPMKPEDAAKMHEWADKLKDQIREDVHSRVLVNPPVVTIPRNAPMRPFTVTPAPRAGDNAELRREIRELRDEIERLRDEMHRGKPLGGTSEFVVPFGSI